MNYAVVTRDRSQPKGPGVLELYDANETLVGRWNCITGGDEKLDPAQYGGVTPPIHWRMVEAIEYRTHPQGHKMTMARIHPVVQSDAHLYSQRTYALDKWPFMIHRAGTSTGCIAVQADQWDDCSRALNAAWLANGGYLEIEVRESV